MNFIADDFSSLGIRSCVQELTKELINEAFFLFVFLLLNRTATRRKKRSYAQSSIAFSHSSLLGLGSLRLSFSCRLQRSPSMTRKGSSSTW
jgi:hypothetical protein